MPEDKLLRVFTKTSMAQFVVIILLSLQTKQQQFLTYKKV